MQLQRNILNASHGTLLDSDYPCFADLYLKIKCHEFQMLDVAQQVKEYHAAYEPFKFKTLLTFVTPFDSQSDLQIQRMPLQTLR